jgi:putative inorganic carbon (HCO3(-)) transporter
MPWLVSVCTKAEYLSFLTALALLATLPLPQFATEKEGLAVLAALGIALYLFSKLATNNHTNTSVVDMLVIAILAINAVSAFSSHYFQASLVGLTKVAIYVLSYFWFKNTIAAYRGRSGLAISILLASGLSVALYGLYQYKTGVEPLATWEDPTIEQKATRIYSTLGNPNLLAGYLTALAPLAAALGFAAFFKKRYMLSAIPFAAALVLSSALVLTGSRGAYIAFFAWLAFLFVVISLYTVKSKPMPRRYLLLLAVALVIAVPAAIHFFPFVGQRLSSIFVGSEHSSNAFRLNVWRAAWRMFLDNWWLGIGPGNKTFILAYGLYMLSGFDALGTYCVPLEVAVETGIVGLFIFGALFLSLMARAHLTFRAANNDFDRWLCVGCAAGLLGIMVHGLVDTVFFRPQVQFIFWLIAALIASTYRRTFSMDSTSEHSKN